jgi:hypothetical protein
VSELSGLPIGPGKSARQWRPLEVADDRHDDDDEHELEAALPPIAELHPVAPPAVEIVQWDAGKLRPPLKLVGKTVNWRVRARLGLETDAGLMTEENLTDIGEPLAEIANRYDVTRALASKSTELALVMAIYDYGQETAVKAGRAKQTQIDAQRVAQRFARAEQTPAPPRVVNEGTAIDSEEGIDL